MAFGLGCQASEIHSERMFEGGVNRDVANWGLGLSQIVAGAPQNHPRGAAGALMSQFNRSPLPSALMLAMLTLGLAGCSGGSISNPFSTSEPAPLPPAQENLPSMPPAFPPQDIVGRWGLAAYHKDEDRARIEAAAANQCKQPYIITLRADRRRDDASRRPGDADRAAPERRAGQQDLYRPGRRSARQPAGPRSGLLRRPRAGPALDRSEVQGRYGTMVYVRCGPEGEKRPKPKAKPAAKPKPVPRAAPKPVQPPIQKIPPAR